MKTTKKLLAILLAVIMLFSSVPVGLVANAARSSTVPNVTITAEAVRNRYNWGDDIYFDVFVSNNSDKTVNNLKVTSSPKRISYFDSIAGSDTALIDSIAPGETAKVSIMYCAEKLDFFTRTFILPFTSFFAFLFNLGAYAEVIKVKVGLFQYRFGFDVVYADGTEENEETSTNSYTVNFNANCTDAEGMPAAQKVKSGKYAQVPTDPQRLGYEFWGWATDTAGQNAFDFYANKITADITLYAIWVATADAYDMSNDADPDNDGLTNAEEAQIGTDPLNYDTDGDGVSDGTEVKLGTDPKVYHKAFKVTATSKEEDTVKPSVQINLSGEQVETLVIEPVRDDELFPETMPGYLGQAYDFSVSGEFEEAVISFEFEASLLGKDDFDPTIYYFNELDQVLEPLETTVTGNIASATVEHFSTYILIDRTVYERTFEWQDIWDNTQTYTNVEIVFVVDDSGSMSWNDPYDERLTVSRNLIDNLPADSKIGLVKFDGYSPEKLTTTLTADKNTVKNYLTTSYFYSSGGTDMYEGIQTAFPLFESSDAETLKMIVVLSDGETDDTHLHSTVVSTANASGVRVYTVGLGTDSTYYFNNYLKPLAENTNAKFYLADDASQLAEIYEDISEKIDINTDSDNDGIPDYYEDNMICFNGVKLALDKNNPDTDGDGKLDGEEVVLTRTESADGKQVLITGKIVSNPCKAETLSTNDKIIKNLENGLTSKKETLVAMAKVLLDEGYEPAFVAGILANIYSEGTVGRFESSNYSDPNKKPKYLKYMDDNYSYRTKYSYKLIYDGISLSELKNVMDSIKADGYQKGKFGLGCVQWTGGRTYNLVNMYIKVANGSDTITKEQAFEAEALMISSELKGSHKNVYNSWKASVSNNINSRNAANEAGKIICNKYEIPANHEQKAITRGNLAADFYDIMMK